MTQTAVQNHQFLIRQLTDCMQACREAYAEAQQCDIPNARERLEKVFTDCYDLKDDLTIYSDQIAFARETDDYTMILARVEQLKQQRVYFADAMRTSAVQEAFSKPQRQNSDIEDDDDVTFEGGDVETGLICPLTSKLPEHPVVSRVCHHVFEKNAIEDWIRMNTSRNRSVIECPKAGCNAQFGLKDLVRDDKVCDQVEKARRSKAGTNDWEKI